MKINLKFTMLPITRIVKKFKEFKKSPAGDPWNKKLPFYVTGRVHLWITIINLILFILLLCMSVEVSRSRLNCEAIWHPDNSSFVSNSTTEFASYLAKHPFLRFLLLVPNNSKINVTWEDARKCQLLFPLGIILVGVGALALLILLRCSGSMRGFVYRIPMRTECDIDRQLSTELRKIRSEYLRKNPRKTNWSIVSKMEFGLHIFNPHDVEVSTLECCKEVKASLQELMLREMENDEHRVIDAVLYIHDLLRAVEYMHKRNVYHLDLQPATVYVHWPECTNKPCTVFEDIHLHNQTGYGSAQRHHFSSLLLSTLNYAVTSESGKVPSKGVGFTEFYRPPECFTEKEVDAGKVDSWGVGVTAFEILTGGMLTILAQSTHPHAERYDTVLKQALNKTSFNTVVDNFYKIFGSFIHMSWEEVAQSRHNLDHSEFLLDYLNFVNGLLEINPNKRYSIQQALDTPLMKRVHSTRVQRPHLFYINFPFKEDNP